MNAYNTINGERHYNPWLIAVVVSLATFMEVLDTTITNVSLTHIAGSLAASREESTWVLTSYLVANGIVLPISGWLSSVFGRKRFFMMCIAAFTFASLMCGLATSLPMLIVFRLIQGLAGGGLQPTQQAIIMDSFPPERRGAVFAVTGVTMIVAPILGPTLGGWITDNFTWPWIFFINVPVGILAITLVNTMVRDPEHAHATGFGNIDYIGLSFVALAIGCMQVVLDKGQQGDWFSSSLIVTMTIISACAFVFGILWLHGRKNPVVDLTLFEDRSFALGTVLIFITGFVLYGSSALFPMLVESQFGYDATMAGLVLSPGALAVMAMMPISGKLVSRVAPRYLILVGLTLCATGCFITSQAMNLGLDYQSFVWLRTLQMLGVPFLFIPVSTLAFMKVPKEKSTKASSLFSLARNMGGSVGIAVVTTYLSRQTQIHQNMLVDHLASGDIVYDQTIRNMTVANTAAGLSPLDASHQALGGMYHTLQSQSAILGYQDTFMFMATLMAAAVALALFLPTNNPRAKSAPA